MIHKICHFFNYFFVFQDVCEFLQSGGMVAVYDATNTTKARRELLQHIVCERMGYKLFFIESICEASPIIETNIMVGPVNVSVLIF